MDIYYKCIQCGKIYPFHKDLLTCTKHSQYYGYLTVMYDYKNIRLLKNNDLSSWEKYQKLLPPKNLQINFNEQKTPLILLKKFGKKYSQAHLYVKDESKNPTGSFKDKGAACAVNTALEWGIRELFVVSSGNAALSIAAYAHKADIMCHCLVSKNLSVGKRLLISLYGAKIIEQDGNYEKMYRNSIDNSYPGWNSTPGINSLHEEGVKIIGFEIWEDIGVPDVIIIPCGNGTLLYGIYKAFKELEFLGLIDHLPKLIGIQVKNASPLKTALETKKDFVQLLYIPDSIAEGIVAEESYSSPKVMLALQDTHGAVVEVDDLEIKDALQEIIASETLIPEPTAAAVYAGFKKMSFSSNEKVVLIQTAGGTKNLKEIMEIVINKQQN